MKNRINFRPSLSRAIGAGLSLAAGAAVLLLGVRPAAAAKAPDDAKFITHSVPHALSVGETTDVSVTFENTGTSTWTKTAGYKLSTENPQDNKWWVGETRVDLAPGESIAPRAKKTFAFKIKAPSTPGTYNFQWKMIAEGGAPHRFGDESRNVVIDVIAHNAQFESQNVPSSMTPGQTVEAEIKIKNTGASTWTKAGGFKLSTQNPQDNKTWIGGTRIDLAPSDSIAPGQTKTFAFKIKAPSAGGTYNFQWKMICEGKDPHRFGEETRNVAITVRGR